MSGWSQPGLGQTELIEQMSREQLAAAAAGGFAPKVVGFDPISLAVSGAIMGVTYGISKWRQGVKRRAASTQIVNQGEPYLKNNLATYQSSPRTTADQEQAILNFYQVWSEVVRQCEAVGGNAGRACIEDRQEGSSPPWGGGNWFELYLDPIRNDPNVQPVPSAFSGESVSVMGAEFPAWAIALAIGAVGLFALGGSK